MAGHDWISQGFVHGAPGADCWDQRVVCTNCDSKAVLLNQRRPVKRKAYDSKVGASLGKERVAKVRELKPSDYVPEDCDLIVVDSVHSR